MAAKKKTTKKSADTAGQNNQPEEPATQTGPVLKIYDHDFANMTLWLVNPNYSTGEQGVCVVLAKKSPDTTGEFRTTDSNVQELLEAHDLFKAGKIRLRDPNDPRNKRPPVRQKYSTGVKRLVS